MKTAVRIVFSFAWTVFLLLFLVLPVLAEDAMPPKLYRDPFDHPDLTAQASRNDSSVTVSDPLSGKEELVIKGILIGDGWSIVNVNGEMLLPGESINGFTLVGITEEQVLFRKDSAEVSVRLDEKK